MNQKKEKEQNVRTPVRRVTLAFYDCILLLISITIMLVLNPSGIETPSFPLVIIQTVSSGIFLLFFRIIGKVYLQVWRYGGSSAYIRLIVSDMVATFLYVILQYFLPTEYRVTMLRAFSVIALNLVLSLTVRHFYQHAYENARKNTSYGRFICRIASKFAGLDFERDERTFQEERNTSKIRIAIVGAGRIGVMLAEELQKNPRSSYTPICFIDVDRTKIGREIMGLPVLCEEEAIKDKLLAFSIQEIVFALPPMSQDKKKTLYEIYLKTNLKIKVYDYPIVNYSEKGKRHMRTFDVEELLFRNPVSFLDEQTSNFYMNKCVLISGGGGSIGGEIARQIATMHPKKLVLLDIYENGVYDIQQELKIMYGSELDLSVEIVSVTDKESLDKVFSVHRPNIVLHAAAHKHVPLMEHNCIEAVQNNVFGTKTIVETAEKYAVNRFIMISTDKAVNPTNVMGATKRVCEMIVQSKKNSVTSFSATRFGNVLGSNGSVIPLFKRQIAKGGPITLTDKRIIRYFMTIPEASQLVLQSGAMAKSGELYVLDMGKPVKILDLAENMIRLSGYEPYQDIDIVETGLRPGEKLFEELLIKSEELDKTTNSMIFIERDTPKSKEEIQSLLSTLKNALDTMDDECVKSALHQVVPTYHLPEEVNATVLEAKEKENVNTAVAG